MDKYLHRRTQFRGVGIRTVGAASAPLYTNVVSPRLRVQKKRSFQAVNGRETRDSIHVSAYIIESFVKFHVASGRLYLFIHTHSALLNVIVYEV